MKQGAIELNTLNYKRLSKLDDWALLDYYSS